MRVAGIYQQNSISMNGLGDMAKKKWKMLQKTRKCLIPLAIILDDDDNDGHEAKTSGNIDYTNYYTIIKH